MKGNRKEIGSSKTMLRIWILGDRIGFRIWTQLFGYKNDQFINVFGV
jgi:hypothetical protein